MDRFTQSLFMLLLLSSAVNQGLSSKPSFWTAAPHTQTLEASPDGTEKAHLQLELSGRAGIRRLTRVDCMGGSERQQVITISRDSPTFYKADAAKRPEHRLTAHTPANRT